MIPIGGDMDHGRPRSMPTPSTTDPSQFTKALQQAAAHIHIVPATIEAGQLALAKKKEKTNKLKQLHNSKYSLDIMTSTQPTSTSESFLYVSFISERKDQHIVASDDAGRLPSCFLLLY